MLFRQRRHRYQRVSDSIDPAATGQVIISVLKFKNSEFKMSTGKFQVRTVTAADRADWEPLWLAYIEFYKSTMSAEKTEILWQRILDPAHEIQCRVAYDDQRLMGLVHFFPHAHTWFKSQVCYLNDLFVSPAVRSGGTGAALIAAVVEEAEIQEWAEVYWHTQDYNTVARGLYDKITGGTDGFVNYTIAIGNQTD
jgi:GNAT superfamily N-acetyltransferase